MRNEIHPQYNKVLFLESSTGEEWVGVSTMSSADRREVNGEELPVIKLEISSASHPFWTGQARTLDSEGRIDRFKRRYSRKG